ncbi:hypothetical protein UCRPA7_8798 [Phaeoacremonium minimum UCRPA7]|uniref:Uncharacterized protein n=1 Tax=Phaeoacremonium minimum (strain UCR-PA7) TaxID=1286976 RepID=R8B8P9_PHAM7|nr:hypothetical protein UCRPA7_8798 [Phaeoacremonium minimum UCRPA7]EON95668.1 hypothetical protein UCRPA7_8798 [Phaeoacremonium minimum UCRPA7]
MEYKDVPETVKDWIEEQQDDNEGDTKWLFAVYDKPKEQGVKIKGTAKPRATDKAGIKENGENKVMLFAAGAIYETLPLWVAEGSNCKDDLLDLENYNPEPEDKGVVAWVVERSEPEYESDKRDITFQIKAQRLKKTLREGDGSDKDEL